MQKRGMRVWKYVSIILLLTSLAVVREFILSLHQRRNFVKVSTLSEPVQTVVIRIDHAALSKKTAAAARSKVVIVRKESDVTNTAKLTKSSLSVDPERVTMTPEMSNKTGEYHDAAAAVEAPEWKPLDKSELGSINYFLIFVGWPRSCHSIIGSMLDAHPNVIVAHEYYLFKKLTRDRQLSSRRRLFNELYRNSYMNARKGWRASNQTQKGYTLNMGSSWQGQFTKLRVIGDKCGGDTTGVYMSSRNKFKGLYRILRANVKVPIKVLQVVRNPFDMIATVTLYRGSGLREVKVSATATQKYANFSLLNVAIASILNTSTAILKMVPDMKLSPLKVHCEDLISHPAETMSNICQFLNLECSREYLQMCVDKTFRNVSASRHLVEWDPDTLPSLITRIKTFPFFHRYSFDGDL